ncbi:MAG: Asp-tRNA(Asn)/Glu-tRNA(Gln) amidotransferase subunit GatC [Lachnospiraceae bacterium]|nr:Asp-tRNA(Asn)/Glu-tRNA(Gln) amidotransferase subunit GatC [Lachnospiraceae bacterium]
MTLKELTDLESLNEFKLTDSEENKALELFDFMADEAKIFQNLNTDGVEVMVHCMPMTNVFRDDVREQAFSRDDLLKGSPERSEDSWVVPRLVK